MRAYELRSGDSPARREVDPFETEAQLERLLHGIPDLLLDEKIILIGRQVGVETGTLDLLGLDKYGNLMVFELKKGASGSGSASEGSILSQPQEYAQALQWFSYEDLDEVYAEYRTERGAADGPVDPADVDGSLQVAFRDRFGTSLEQDSFNQHQRMVVVAEEITDRTAANVRYLRDEGLHFQCVEVQRFRLTDAEATTPMLVASTVIDYDQKRVQPHDDDAITYPDINEAIASRAFPAIEELTRATSPTELFPGGFDLREPRLRSLHPDHPDAVRYAFRVKPLEEEHLRLSIDVTTRGLDIDKVDKEMLTGRLRSAADRFEAAGFAVDQNRNTFRIVTEHWDVDSVAEIRDDAFLNEVADRFAELVRIGHEELAEGE